MIISHAKFMNNVSLRIDKLNKNDKGNALYSDDIIKNSLSNLVKVALYKRMPFVDIYYENESASDIYLELLSVMEKYRGDREAAP